MEGYSYF